MTQTSPILRITDGTTHISLLDTQGFLLCDWIPALADPKNGGVWADSPMVEGRRLVYRQPGNTIDTFDLTVRAATQDSAIVKLQDLRRLLEKAIEYWTTDPQNEPVWLEAKAAWESNTRYAIISDYRTPRDNNPFRMPFFSCHPLVTDFMLAIEHGPWMGNPPGQSTCVEISAQYDYPAATTILTETLMTFANDVTVTLGNLTDTGDLYVGLLAGAMGLWYSQSIGLRFPNVPIPTGASGATVLRAWVDLVCTESTGGDAYTVNALIRGEDADDSAAWTDGANFLARTRTSSQVVWQPPMMNLGWTYSTPDLTTIIQEIIDRPGWVNNNDMTIFIEENGSQKPPCSPWGCSSNRRGFSEQTYGCYTAARLYIEYISSPPATYGMEATCNVGTVFIANKQNMADLTDVYYYDAGTTLFSTNRLITALPYDLLPAAPVQANDYVCFGSTVGPFSSLVFDITTAQADVTTIIWQYYNTVGADGGWETLDVMDHTMTTDPFDTVGIQSVHWVQPDDWTTATINTVTGYWVRAKVTAVGAAPTPPQQGNRDIYTVTTPYVDFTATQVMGDFPALGRIRVENQSDEATGDPELWFDRLIVGSRSLSRGTHFTPYINISDEQNPTGVTVSLTGGTTVYSNDSTTITGRLATYTAAATTNIVPEVTITLDQILAAEYQGRYRAFLRYELVSGFYGLVAFRLVTLVGSYGMQQYSDWYIANDWYDDQTVDLGIVEIPPRAPGDQYYEVKFMIESQSDGTGGQVFNFYDLILMPVDEWSTDAIDKASRTTFRVGAVGNDRLLDLDSVTYPRDTGQAILRDASDGRILGYYQNRQAGPVLLEANSAQRLWFLCLTHDTGSENFSWHEVCNTVQVDAAARYLSARGSR